MNEPNAFASLALSMLLTELDRVWDRLGEEMASEPRENQVAKKVRLAMKAAGVPEIDGVCAHSLARPGIE